MATATQILTAVEEFSLYLTFVLFVVGNVGSMINLLVLSTLKLFRGNQCVFYLIVECVVNIGQLTILCTIYILPLIYKFEPGNVSTVWCKLKNVLPQLLRLLSTSMVCLAAFDQFLSTSHRLFLRQCSSLRLARRLCVAALCLWVCHSIPYTVFYAIVPPSGCINRSAQLIKYYSFFYYPILHGLLPILMSSLLSLLAYRNVRYLVRRQVPVVRRRLDRQLTAMVFVRVIVFVILLLPYTIYRIYSLNVTIARTEQYRFAVDRLIYSVTSSLSNFNYAVRWFTLSHCSAAHLRRAFWF